jgi:dTDP-4-amino-4,6-dideoxygalactose transaminase
MESVTTSDAATWNARPYLYGQESDEVLAALLSLNWGNSPLVAEFERDLAAFLGVPDVVTVCSGTMALQLCLLAAGIGPGDEVVVPSLTFCASIQAILACGAYPRFVEVNPDSLCAEPTDLLDAITARTRAVMPVLYGGRAVDTSGIRDALDARGIVIIEDAAHAFGSYRGTERVGATGNLTAFSFDPIKNLTCGEGGAIVPRDEREAGVVRAMRGLGAVRSSEPGALDATYAVEYPGLRARLSAMNAAIGIVQLRHFDEAEAKRKSLWRTYESALRGMADVVLVDVDIDRSTPFHCVIRLPSGRDSVFRFLRAKSVGVGVPYPPNHLEPAFERWGRSLPVTETVGRQIISLPFHPWMTEHDVHHMVSLLGEALSRQGEA